MKKTVIAEAPGKINLSFDITGVRENGYHDVNTIMQTIDLFDTITITRMTGNGIFISCDRPRIPCDETNFAYIAACKFFETFNLPKTGIAIDIQKRIPAQAGLAGGSADAAGVLMAMNVLFDINADQKTLCEIGVQIGADVPFCLLGGTQQAQGVGEQFTKLPDLPKCHIVVAKPEAGISTPESYRRYDRYGTEHHPDIDYMIKQLRTGDIKSLASSMYNVLEEVADLQDIPILRNRMISSGALGTLMSGSGSAVFGIFDSRSLAKRCMRRMYQISHGVFLAEPVNHGAIVLDMQES